MEPGFRVMGHRGHRVSDFGRVESRFTGSLCRGPVFDPVLSFNMYVYRGVISGHLGKLIFAVSVSVWFPSQQHWFTYFS